MCLCRHAGARNHCGITMALFMTLCGTVLHDIAMDPVTAALWRYVEAFDTGGELDMIFWQ